MKKIILILFLVLTYTNTFACGGQDAADVSAMENSIFKTVDKNDSGYIEQNEYLEWMRTSVYSNEESKKMWKQLHKQDPDRLTKEEFRQLKPASFFC